MKIKKHYKLVIGVLLIFISGMIIGGGITYIAMGRKSQKTTSMQKFKSATLKMMTKELELTPKQQKQADLLLDKALERADTFRHKYSTEMLMVIEENNQELKKILTPEQWRMYKGYRTKKLEKE